MDSLLDIIEDQKTKDICQAFVQRYSSKKELKERMSEILEIGKDAIEKNISIGNLILTENDGSFLLDIGNERWFEDIVQKRIMNRIKKESFPESIVIPNSIFANFLYEGAKDISYDIKYLKKQIDISLMSEIMFQDNDLMFYSCLCSFWEKASKMLPEINKIKVRFSDIYKFINAGETDKFLSVTSHGKEVMIPIELKDFLQRMLNINSSIRKSISLGVEPIKCHSYIFKGNERLTIEKMSISSILSFSLDDDGIVLLQKPQILEMNDFLSNQKIILDRKKVFNWKSTADIQGTRFEIMRRVETSKCKKNRMNSSITKKWWERHFTNIHYNSDSLGFFMRRLEKEREITDLEFPKNEESFVRWKSITEKDEIQQSRNHKYRSSKEGSSYEDDQGSDASSERAEIQGAQSKDDLHLEEQ